MVIYMNLKEYRKSLGITIIDASLTTSVPLRTYIRYENNDQYGNSLKNTMDNAATVKPLFTMLAPPP